MMTLESLLGKLHISTQVTGKQEPHSTVSPTLDLGPVGVKKETVTIVHISNSIRKLVESKALPKGDILLHTGTLTGEGTLEELRIFLHHFVQLPYETKVFIGGPADRALMEIDLDTFRSALPPGTHYLRGDSVCVRGVTIFGAPWSSNSAGAFYRANDELHDAWDRIPKETNILLTQENPLVRDPKGSMKLRDIVVEKGVRLHCFGSSERIQCPLRDNETIYSDGVIRDSGIFACKFLVPVSSPKISLKKPIAKDSCTVSLKGGSQVLIRLVHISDTHGHLGACIQRGEVPHGDILIHSGDFTDKGTSDEIRQFAKEFNSLPHKIKIVIAGNHEYGIDKVSDEEVRVALAPAVYLNDSSVTIHGIKFYGTPWNNSSRGAFGASLEERAKRFASIPRDTDVLISHIPPLGILDLAWVKNIPSYQCNICPATHSNFQHWGCSSLLRVIQELNIPIALFGHVHDEVGMKFPAGNTLYSNAAMDIYHRAMSINIYTDIEQ